MNLHCKRCKHRWKTRYANAPKVCPACKRTDWNGPQQKLSANEQLAVSRKQAGITLKEMADYIGVSISTLCLMEQGKRHVTVDIREAYAAKCPFCLTV